MRRRHFAQPYQDRYLLLKLASTVAIMTKTIKKLFRIGTICAALVSLCFVVNRRVNTFYSVQPLEVHRRVCNLVLSERWNDLNQYTTGSGFQELRYMPSPSESKSIRTFLEDKKPESNIHSFDVVRVYSEHSKDGYFMYRYSRPHSRWLLWHAMLGN